jgi:hypothetical protein
MKVSPRILVLAWVALGVFAAACGGVPLQPADDGGGADAYDCTGLEQKTCLATVGCTEHLCPACYGQTTWECYLSAGEPPACGECRDPTDAEAARMVGGRTRHVKRPRGAVLRHDASRRADLRPPEATRKRNEGRGRLREVATCRAKRDAHRASGTVVVGLASPGWSSHNWTVSMRRPHFKLDEVKNDRCVT